MKYVLAAVLCICFACNDSENTRKMNNVFREDIGLVADLLPVKEVINPGNFVKLKGYLIVQNEYIPGEDCFYVYSLDKMKFCFSFGRLGQSNDEFIAPIIVQNNSGNSLSIFDSAHDKIFVYNISDTSSQLINERKIMDVVYPTQEISYVNDSIILFQITGSVGNRLYSYNINTNNILDSLEFDSGLKKIMNEKYNPNFDFYNLTNVGRKFVVGFNYINEFKVGELDNEYKFHVHEGPKLKNYALAPTNPDKLYKNYFYYMFPSVTSELLFLPYLGQEATVLQPFPINLKGRHFDFYIEVYDWSLNPIARLKFDNDLIKLCIDEERHKIYTWNPMKDFDNILVYSIDNIGIKVQ